MILYDLIRYNMILYGYIYIYIYMSRPINRVAYEATRLTLEAGCECWLLFLITLPAYSKGAFQDKVIYISSSIFSECCPRARVSGLAGPSLPTQQVP